VLGGVVIDKGNGEDVGVEAGRLGEVAQDGLAEVAGADDEGAVLGAAGGDGVAGGEALM